MQKLKKTEDINKKKIQKRTKRVIRRKNAKIYPIYKMFSWDLIGFYSIQFLFYTITKRITVTQVLLANALYLIFKTIMEIPAVTICDLLGHKKSLIIGNILMTVNMMSLIFIPGFVGIVIANFFFSFGYNIKTISESNLLYESVSTRGGEGIYSKMEIKGSSLYYFLDGIFCLIAGLLFNIDNYIPIYICTLFTLISTILSFKFEDIHKKQIERKNIAKEYILDLKNVIKFILNSNRMRSYIIFGAIFFSMIKLVGIYKSELLLKHGMTNYEYSTVVAIATLISGFLVSYTRKFYKKFKNKTLTILSLPVVIISIVTGIVSIKYSNNIIIPCVVIACIIYKTAESIWYILEYKYLKNFTTENIRNKIMFTYEAIGSLAASIVSIIGSLLLDIASIDIVFLITSLIFCIGIILSLDYMKTRFGLKPNQYKKEDIG